MLDIILFNTDKEKSAKTINCIMEDAAFKQGLITIYFMDFNGTDLLDDQLVDTNSDKILYIDVHEKSTPEVYNYAIKISKGNYICFITNNGVYQKNALKFALSALNTSDIISFNPIYSNDEITQNYIKFNVCFDSSGLMNIDLMSTFPERFHLCFSSFYFKKSLLENIILMNEWNMTAN